MHELAPLLIFTYKRVDFLDSIISSLNESPLCAETDLFIFVDGPNCEKDILLVSSVLDFVQKIEGFKSITIYESKFNKGLASSIIDGVSLIFSKYNKVIVLEDDLIPSSNFLEFMNSALKFYENNYDVYSISAFDLIDKSSPSKKDAYFLQRSWPWGWGTWHDRWVGVDWDILEYKEFLSDKKLQRDFNLLGSDLSQMLIRQISGELDSWSIRWTYHIYKKNGFVLYPNFSKIDNKGWDQYATNTKGSNRRYQRILDPTAKTTFTFDDSIRVTYSDSIKLHNRFSFLSRSINKLYEYFSFSRL
jgi:hypothetical protein